MMNKQARAFLYGSIIFVAVLSIILIIGLVFATTGHTAKNAVTETTAFGNVIEDSLSVVYNISINNTATLWPENITLVNVTLPSGFVFIIGTNSEDSPFTSVFDFNNGSVASVQWSNTSYALMQNLTLARFSFNATAPTPGTYNFTVNVTQNGTLTTLSQISVTVNNSIMFGTNTNSSMNSTTGKISANITTDASVPIDTLTVVLYNSTNDAVNTSNHVGRVRYLQYTGLADGLYHVNATANYTNSLTGALAFPITQRNLRIDSTVPVVTLTRSTTSTDSQIVLDIAYTETGSGVSSCVSNRGTVSGTTVTNTGLTCGTSYNYVIDCDDYTGNQGTATGAFSTDECSSSGGSGSGSGSGSSWTNTYVEDSSELSDLGSVDKSLKAKERVRVKIGTEKHHVGVLSISGETATIEVSSTPQQAVFNVGDVKKFDVDANGYYDISVTLSSIEANKANVVIMAVNEKVTTVEEEKKDLPESPGTESAGSETVSEGKSSTGWIIGIIVAVLVVGAIVFFVIKRKK